MIYSGIKKLAKEMGLKHNGYDYYGFVHHTFVTIHEFDNEKSVHFIFPHDMDEDDRKYVKFWDRQGYANEIRFTSDVSEKELSKIKEMNDDGEHFVPRKDIHAQATATFKEYFFPYKNEKIKETVINLANYFEQKYPEARPRCANCASTSNVHVYDEGFLILTPLCDSCAREIREKMERSYEDLQNMPNNYFRGLGGAALFCLPCLLALMWLFFLRSISFLSTILFALLSYKGYFWAEGKRNYAGLAIIGLTTLLFSVGAYFMTYWTEWMVDSVGFLPGSLDDWLAESWHAIRISVYEPANLLINLAAIVFFVGVDVYSCFFLFSKHEFKKCD